MRRFGPLLFAFALLAAALGLRGPFLHRVIWNIDEGVTFTMAEQVLHGGVLYRDAADHRPPLIPYLKAALFAVFGEWNTFAIHLIVALLLGGCALALWSLARRLGDEPAGVAAAIVFTALSFVMLDPVDALSANTGWFLVAFSTAGFLAFSFAVTKRSLAVGLLSGGLFGLSFLCKQPGLLDFGVTWVLLGFLAITQPADRRFHLRLWLAMLLGAAVPVGAFTIYFAAHGTLPDALYYAFTYNTKVYVPEVPLLGRLAMMRRPFELAFEFVPVALALVVGGAVALFVRTFRALRSGPDRLPLLPWLILGWAATGLVSTGLSGRGFSHYSIQIVPGFSLAAGWLIARLLEMRRSAGPWLARVVVSVLILVSVLVGFDCVRRYRSVGLDESFGDRIGRLIARHSAPSDRVFVWGYSPELHVYARRLPASRFTYSNFLTGLIPWTNLDPFVDTTYAVVPGSREALVTDLRRHPAALIVDTGTSHGYLKYPLRDQPALWEITRTGYAQIDSDITSPIGIRLYRRLRDFAPASIAAGLPENADVAVTGFARLDSREPPQVRVRAPAGATAVELYSGEDRLAVLDCAPEQPVDALFFVGRISPGQSFRAVIHTPTGRSRSPALRFAAFVAQAAPPAIAGPALHVGGAEIIPAVERSDGAPSSSPSMPDTWRVDAPTRLVYPIPAGVDAVSFVHGQEAAAQGESDGYDLLVEFQDRSGASHRLDFQRLDPRTSSSDQRPQKRRLALPAHAGGQLIFRFLAGKQNNPDFDWIFFGQLRAETRGPAILLGDQLALPIEATGPEGHALPQLLPHRWATHSPTRLEWRRPDALATLDLTFGLDEGSYTAANGHSDGVEISLDLIGDDGQTRRLFAQTLWPFNHPEHRGPQHAHLDLPPHTPGRLVYRVDPGPHGDVSWDWAWLDDPIGEGWGPAIVIDAAHRLVPDSSRVLDGSPSKRDGPDRWGAHADSELVFSRPANLQQVTFTYGLADAAARDENGQRRSDGVAITVAFTPAGSETPVTIFRRALDPFANASDFGPQTTTIDLPPWQSGRLVFRIDRGPNGDASYDWAFWGPFTGKTQ